MGKLASLARALAVCAILPAGAAHAANIFGIAAPTGADALVLARFLRAQYLRVDIEWSAIEPERGVVAFGPIDQRIAQAAANGMRVFATLRIGRGAWVTGRQPGDAAERSYPPADLQPEFNQTFGHSQRYATFLSVAFRRYRGQIDYVAVESEPDASWGGSIEDYLRVLRTARRVIRAADPNVRIVDGGVSSRALGLAIAKDWISTGARARADAVKFAVDYYSTGVPAASVPAELKGEQAVTAALDSPDSPFNVATWPEVNALLDGISGEVDALDLHYAESYRWLATAAEWLRARTRRAPRPYSVPLVTSELAVRADLAAGCTPTAAELDRLGRETFKSMVAARAAGIAPIILHAEDTLCLPGHPSPDRAGVLNEGARLRPAGEAFARLAEPLSAVAGPNRLASAGPELWQYVFNDASGKPTIVAAWSEGAPRELKLLLTGSGQVFAADHAGQSIPVQSEGARIAFNVSGPVFARLPAPIDFRFVTVSSASYRGGPLAAESIVSAFGEDLRTEPSDSTLPLTYIDVRDSQGIARRARVFYLSPAFINFQLPPGAAHGPATISVGRGDAVVATSAIDIAAISPGLFAANGDATGVAAAAVTRVLPDGSQSIEPVARFDEGLSRFVPVAIDLGPESERVVLQLYGTGIRFGRQVRAVIGGMEAEILYAGPAGDLVGLDLVNAAVPRALAGRGEVEVFVEADGVASNAVRAIFK